MIQKNLQKLYKKTYKQIRILQIIQIIQKIQILYRKIFVKMRELWRKRRKNLIGFSKIFTNTLQKVWILQKKYKKFYQMFTKIQKIQNLQMYVNVNVNVNVILVNFVEVPSTKISRRA